MSRHGVERVTRRTLEPYLGCLARDGEDEKNLYAALATLELAANRPHAVIDEAVRLEFEKTTAALVRRRGGGRMRGAFKGRSGYVAGAVALLVVGFSLISGLARRIGVVEPRIRIERSGDNNPSQAARAARYSAAQGAMVGETATTAERLREASALAAAGAWLAVTQRNATAEGLLRKLEAMGMLPAGAVIAADKGNALATPYGALIFHYRAAPIGVEALSLGRTKRRGRR